MTIHVSAPRKQHVLTYIFRRRSDSRAAAIGDAPALDLRAGEWVEVRSLEEILATLDGNGRLDGLPFMPEMLQYSGKRFRVYKSAHKTCDTIERYAIRRMDRTVHLDGLRCAGAAPGGCQAACLLFWKEAWLRHVGDVAERESSAPPAPQAAGGAGQERAGIDVSALQRTVSVESSDGSAELRYRCQATELLNATSTVRRRDRWNPLFYLKDLTSGNVTLLDFVRYGTLAAFNAFTLRWFGRRYPHVCGRAGARTPTTDQHLRPGDLVRVRSKQEILRTLNAGMRNRGLWFDVEMVPYCEAGPFKVLRKVERLVDERTGRLLRLSNPCFILDGVACGGKLSTSRMFCPRSVYPYWRTVWLDRVQPPAAAAIRND